MLPTSINILLVIDPISDKKITIKKVAGFINTLPSTVHLLCIVKSWHSFAGFEIKPPFKGTLKGDIETYVNKIIQLQEWRQAIEIACPGAQVKMHIQKSFWTIATIIRAAKALSPHVVIVNRGRRNRFFPFIRSFSPGRLAKKLSCRVITVNASSRAHESNSPETLKTSLFKNKN